MLRIFKKSKKKEREFRSLEILKMHGIDCNSQLPLIDYDAPFVMRSIIEIAERIIILFVLNKVATNELDPVDAKRFLERYPLYFHLTKEESCFLQSANAAQKNDESWKMERIWTLLWSLKLVETITFPTSTCATEKINSILSPNKTIINPYDFYQQCKQQQTSASVLDMTDLYLRLNWFCIENKLEHKNLNKINSKVVFERLYALKWLNKSESFEWDAMPCDRLNELSII